jgi:HD superfamily phosphohydrolase
MHYHDVLYGSWKVPSIIDDLIHTKEAVRIRRISQSTIPNVVSPKGPMASRFEHGMGVALLAEMVLRNNSALEEEHGNLLRASAFLHDAGNPPFSHLSEYFLHEVLGLNGETFLATILENSETKQVLLHYGLSCRDIVSVVTGSSKPLSDIVHGSMDIDNLDNVARAAYYFGLKIPRRTFLDVARAYRWCDASWCLDMQSLPDARLWKEARRVVYEYIYSETHLAAGMMLYRAEELAFLKGEIKKDFFLMNDGEAFSYLQKECNQATQCLIERLIRWQWYREVMRIEVSSQAAYPNLQALASGWRGRNQLAEVIAKECQIAPESVCVYVGKGKDNRVITIPFISYDSTLYDAEGNGDSITRLMVYVPEDIYHAKQERIKGIVHGTIS